MADTGEVALRSVTVVSTMLAVPAGVIAVIDVELLTVTDVASPPPKLTTAGAANPVPVIVTDVPPAAGPKVGLILLTVG